MPWLPIKILRSQVANLHGFALHRAFKHSAGSQVSGKATAELRKRGYDACSLVGGITA